MLSRALPSRLVSRLKDGHQALSTLPALSRQHQREWAAFEHAMDIERDRWIAKAALPNSAASSSVGVQLALDLASVVASSVRRDIEDARVHVDKFLALSHRILPGESHEAAKARRAGTPDEARAMFRDRMATIEANRQKSLIAALCNGVAKDPASESALLALGQQWDLEETTLRREFAERVPSTGAPAAGDGQAPNGRPA